MKLPGVLGLGTVQSRAASSKVPFGVGNICRNQAEGRGASGKNWAREVGDVSGEKNLIPFDQRTEAEQKAIRTAGGVASGAARRRKRSLREAADLYLSLPVSDRRRWNKIARKGVDPEDVDNQMAMIIGLTEAATQGDARAAKIIVDLLGDVAGEDQGGVQIIDDL